MIAKEIEMSDAKALVRIYTDEAAFFGDQRVYRVIVDRAESTLGIEDACPFCSVMLSVPAAIACADSGDVAHARDHLLIAERSAKLWQGTAWEAGLEEARAHVALAEGDRSLAAHLFAAAVEQYERSGQPLDAERCRRTVPT